MKINIILTFIVLFSLESYGQEKPILVFDLINGTVDSIPIVVYDSTILSDRTEYFVGNFNSIIETLEQTPPVTNIYPGSNFTYKKQASIDYNLTNYPIRTSIRLFSIQDDSLAGACSGSLISSRHVLTSAHCVSPMNSNVLSQDSLVVYPVFDNGVSNTQFNSSYVSKIYFFKGWDLQSGDLAILELEKPIGESTGWLSIGFDKIDTNLSRGTFFKFSYPGRTILHLDSNEYNGDTLYYNYGSVDLLTNFSIGINNTNGVPGESGSSLIKVKNGQEYTSYGVLNLSGNLKHVRINNWEFYALKNIIANDLNSIMPPKNNLACFTLYPNPTSNQLIIDVDLAFSKISIVDLTGKTISTTNQSKKIVDVTDLAKGIYFIQLLTKEGRITKKFVKK